MQVLIERKHHKSALLTLGALLVFEISALCARKNDI